MPELFENFELNKEPKWPTLLRLTGGSMLLHIGLLWLVVYVPAFRDALNIAALIASTKYVDKAYSRTEIADEVTLVDLANQKFHYPEGYFALDNQQPAEQLAAGISGSDPFAPKIISRAESQKDLVPEASPSPSPAASPSISPSATASPSTVAVANASASPDDKNKKLTPEESQKKLEQTAAENNLVLPDEAELNKQVLKDFAKYANDLKEQGKLDLNKPFEVVIEAELEPSGKLKNPRFTKKAGDENLVDVFARMVAALNDSGFLIYLKPISNDNPNATIIFTIKQGETEVLASVESEASSTTSARVLAKALNAALVFGAGSRAGKDEEVLMKNTNVTPDGKKILVNFSMPRQSVVDIIKKQLEPGV
jgi:hypothetical protein